MEDDKEYNLIDPDDPTRKRIITIDGSGRVISIKEQSAFGCKEYSIPIKEGLTNKPI